MKEFWNSRYANKEYAYGITPNKFFKDNLEKLKKGKVLFPAEGEGRNAVYAALEGFEVTAFDPSIEGQRKALLLAKEYNVNIDYRIDSYESVSLEPNSFDVVVLIFAHMPPAFRKTYHQKITSCLKPGGTIILEGFSKEQINNDSGGPKDQQMLFSEEELRSDFAELESINMQKEITILNEGIFHQGEASVIRLIGRK